jgi:hypothetical protein
MKKSMDYNRQKTDGKKEDGNAPHSHLDTLPQRRAVFLDNGIRHLYGVTFHPYNVTNFLPPSIPILDTPTGFNDGVPQLVNGNTIVNVNGISQHPFQCQRIVTFNGNVLDVFPMGCTTSQ